MGNGWAVAIDGSPEVNPLSHSIVHVYMYTCKCT